MSQRGLVVRTHGERETRLVGAALARALPPGATVSLEGPLGAGKTVLVRGLCEALGVTDPVTSPTYTLENEYETATGRRVIHVDCFRLGSVAELEDLALEDRRDADTLLLAEWGDRVIVALPPETIRVTIEPEPEGDSEARRIVVALPPGVELADLDPGGGE